MEESIGDVVADCAAVFRFDERKPQERAHDYLRERRVARGCDDTAMQVRGVLRVRVPRDGLRVLGVRRHAGGGCRLLPRMREEVRR